MLQQKHMKNGMFYFQFAIQFILNVPKGKAADAVTSAD